MVLHADQHVSADRATTPRPACGAKPTGRWFWFKTAEYLDEWYGQEADRSLPFVTRRAMACRRLLEKAGLPKAAVVDEARRR